MIVEVRGKNGFQVTEAIENYASDKLAKIERYFREELEAFVVCKIYKDHHKVEVTIPTKYFTMRAEVGVEDMYAAIDLAIDKLEAQIRKNKTRMHRSLQKKEGVGELFAEAIDLEALERELVQKPLRRKRIEPETLSADEAITSMDLLGHDFYIYRDQDTGNVHVVYLRQDGSYGVIETV